MAKRKRQKQEFDREVAKLAETFLSDCEASKLGKGFYIIALCSALTVVIQHPERDFYSNKDCLNYALRILRGMYAITGRRGEPKLPKLVGFARSDGSRGR
jgi:hypothetical protein